MKYYIVKLKDGTKLKSPFGEYTEEKIKQYYGDKLESIELFYLVDEEKENNILKRYFKVSLGYDDEMKLSIGEEEIEKVMSAFITGKKVMTSQGAIDGSRIVLIKEDWNKTMGWNETHQLEGEDWNQIKESGAENLYKGFLENIKQNLLDNGFKKLN